MTDLVGYDAGKEMHTEERGRFHREDAKSAKVTKAFTKQFEHRRREHRDYEGMYVIMKGRKHEKKLRR